jgi:hypothetical protein
MKYICRSNVCKAVLERLTHWLMHKQTFTKFFSVLHTHYKCTSTYKAMFEHGDPEPCPRRFLIRVNILWSLLTQQILYIWKAISKCNVTFLLASRSISSALCQSSGVLCHHTPYVHILYLQCTGDSECSVGLWCDTDVHTQACRECIPDCVIRYQG